MKLLEMLEVLRKPIERNRISFKTLKGNRIEYISWYDLLDIIEERIGLDAYSWEIRDVQQVGNYLTLIGTLTLYGEDTRLTREATGIEPLDTSPYGDPSSNAEAMAMRRAAAKFGLGRDLWRKDKPTGGEPKLPPTGAPRSRGELTREEWLRRQNQENPIKKESLPGYSGSELAKGELTREEWLRRKQAVERVQQINAAVHSDHRNDGDKL